MGSCGRDKNGVVPIERTRPEKPQKKKDSAAGRKKIFTGGGVDISPSSTVFYSFPKKVKVVARGGSQKIATEGAQIPGSWVK